MVQVHVSTGPSTQQMAEACSNASRADVVGCGLGAVAASRDEHSNNHSWGLPTAACPASDYLLTDYPASHGQWRAQGRVLVHCSRSGALGNVLRSVPTALLVAMMLDLALVLGGCDRPLQEHGRPVTLPDNMTRYFHSPHLDWRPPPATLPPAARSLEVAFLNGFRARSNLWGALNGFANYTHGQGDPWERGRRDRAQVSTTNKERKTADPHVTRCRLRHT
mmetsp:Transcript_33176/g.82805  ORF Transcript_33176/g.82805 Transcript_33176/m.82805 type:complete len:221 (-) Transcript_33176:76-738(-)